ncbi:MAG TPA: flagellar motor stator protein MotA [Bacteroidota bacterium]|nr:flagellar motor stator protein MotA [Candidatus Kapabacteria bacterium]HRS00979.1 flagellar motor stator protein MotA [Bacteroidota bacterium]HRT67531.1 flagellar motor stator protein MotA [Bacteroidota bacterium]
MFVIVGVIVVFAALIGGFVLAGGNIGTLLVIPEYIIIIGVATGSLLIGNPLPVLKRILNGIIGSFKGQKTKPTDYIELLKMMYEVFQFAKREGLIALEQHVESPESSTILTKYPSFLANKPAVEFFCDTLKVVLSGGIPANDLEDLMDQDLETIEQEEEIPPSSMQTMADSFPGLGIVAAVMGIIITMGAISEGAESVGHHVASALVGTFLGVLLSYGIVGPLAAIMQKNTMKEGKYLQAIKAGLLAFAKGLPASVAIEFARRSIDPENRPTFKETEEAVKQTR